MNCEIKFQIEIFAILEVEIVRLYILNKHPQLNCLIALLVSIELCSKKLVIPRWTKPHQYYQIWTGYLCMLLNTCSRLPVPTKEEFTNYNAEMSYRHI